MIVAVPPTVSESSAADTVAVTPVLQLLGVSVSVDGETVMSLSPVTARLTGTLAVGAALSVYRTVALPPSDTVTADGLATSLGPVAAVTVNDFSETAVPPALSYALACTV